MGKIFNRAAFFCNPKKADGLNSKERRKLERKPLHKEWQTYQRRKNNDGRQTREEESHDTRRIVLKQNEDQEVFDVHVNKGEYDQFLIEEKRQTLIAEIKDLEKKVERKERDQRKSRSSTSKICHSSKGET